MVAIMKTNIVDACDTVGARELRRWIAITISRMDQLEKSFDELFDVHVRAARANYVITVHLAPLAK
jgi:hypothetical protein